MHASIESRQPSAFGHRTMFHVLRRLAAERGDAPALLHRSGAGWEAIGWRRYLELVERFARALLAAGVGGGDRVAILARNRPEWVVADLGAMAAGAVPVGIYTSSSPDQAAWVLAHSGARVLVIDDAAMLSGLRAHGGELPDLETVVLLEGDAAPPAGRKVGWEAFLAEGDEVPAARLRDVADALDPGALATLIYTSGTTGNPKGVMLSHRNLVWTAERLRERYGTVSEEVAVSYLPLSHVAEQLVTIHLPLIAGARIHFVDRIDAVRDALAEVRPTLFLGVPRVWEKIQAGIEAKVAEAPPVRRRVFAAARAVGRAFYCAERPGALTRLAHALVDRAVLTPIRARLGFDRLRFAASSTAPIHPSTLDFFWSIGIPVHQVYGQSEVTGPTSLEIPGEARRGSVGRPLTGVEVRIGEDGEVLVRGENVFLGYFRDDAATREALDADGWLHSGDVGRLDEDGYLWIVDRKKELVVTSGGKKTGPTFIEGLLEAIEPVAHAVVAGDGRNYLAALLTLDPEKARRWARERGLPFDDVAALADDPRLRDHLARAIAEGVNGRLARFETIKRFVVLPRAFGTGPDGELTPTLKLRRRATLQKWAAAVEALYAEPPPDHVTICPRGAPAGR